MDITLKNVKISKALSQETLAFTATCYVDGKRAFEVSNHGTGGANDYVPIDKQAYDKAWNHAIATMTDIKYEQLDCLVMDLVERHEFERTIKREAKNATLFRTPDSAAGEYFRIPAAFSAGMKAQVLAKYPNAEILNETICGQQVERSQERPLGLGY